MAPKTGDGQLYADGWNDCLRAVREFLEALAEGRGSGGDTFIFAALHKIIARALKPHTWEPLASIYEARDLRNGLPCGLCGKGVDDAIHQTGGI